MESIHNNNMELPAYLRSEGATIKVIAEKELRRSIEVLHV
jgi:hypothetical protein